METTTASLVQPEVFALVTPELPADRNPAVVYLARLAPGSRPTMRNALTRIAGLVVADVSPFAFDWAVLRYQHTAAIRARLAEAYAPATANRMLAALRGVLRESWRLGLMPAEEYRRAVDIEPVRGTSAPSGRALARGELLALVGACVQSNSAAGARDAAMLAVLFGGGLRRAEVVALDLADFDAETGALTVRHGKGNRARTAYASNGSLKALVAWLVVRGNEPGPLFFRILKGGRLVPERLTPQAVLSILARCATVAGVAKFSPHDLRRTFISELLDCGADIATVRRLAGHSSVQTTASYDRRGEHAAKRAAEMLSFPYEGRG
jgi:integrase